MVRQGKDGILSFRQETEGGESDPNGLLTAEHAALMRDLIKEYKAKAGDQLQLIWYDSMTESGEMNWQNALTDVNKYAVIDAEGNPVADAMFLNFWWNTNTYGPDELVKATAEKAAELGVDPYEMYAGIDVQANGYKTPVRWNLYAPEGQAPYTSLGLYCPSWTYFSAQDWFTDYQERELTFWVNENMDPFEPTTAEDMEWKGISTYAIEKTAVNSIPFNTIDLGEVKAISEVRIFHAEAGGESSDMNTKAYTILVSEDGENFTQIVQVKKNFAGTSSDTAARIYEVEVYGLNEAL